jgi:hypothetical protein
MTNIYHITHIENLLSIINSGGLWSDNECLRQNAAPVNIAYQNLKARRRPTVVPVAAHGVLGDYVPFYFTTRSPMLYTITRGNVPGVRVYQRDIIYLVSSIERVVQEDCTWCFTDGHAVEVLSHFYTEYADLNQVDWATIQSRYWRDTVNDPDRKRKKQAEFLVHRFFPMAWIQEIGVFTPSSLTRVRDILEPFATYSALNVAVHADWYY